MTYNFQCGLSMTYICANEVECCRHRQTVNRLDTLDLPCYVANEGTNKYPLRGPNLRFCHMTSSSHEL